LGEGRGGDEGSRWPPGGPAAWDGPAAHDRQRPPHRRGGAIAPAHRARPVGPAGRGALIIQPVNPGANCASGQNRPAPEPIKLFPSQRRQLGKICARLIASFHQSHNVFFRKKRGRVAFPPLTFAELRTFSIVHLPDKPRISAKRRSLKMYSRTYDFFFRRGVKCSICMPLEAAIPEDVGGGQEASPGRCPRCQWAVQQPFPVLAAAPPLPSRPSSVGSMTAL